MSMTAQELIDVLVMHYNGSPDEEVISIGHWHAPQWSAPIRHFVPQIALTVGDLRAMASARANVAADHLQALRKS